MKVDCLQSALQTVTLLEDLISPASSSLSIQSLSLPASQSPRRPSRCTDASSESLYGCVMRVAEWLRFPSRCTAAFSESLHGFVVSQASNRWAYIRRDYPRHEVILGRWSPVWLLAALFGSTGQRLAKRLLANDT